MCSLVRFCERVCECNVYINIGSDAAKKNNVTPCAFASRDGAQVFSPCVPGNELWIKRHYSLLNEKINGSYHMIQK